MKQRITEWVEKVDMQYHERQFQEPYRSTILFCNWLEANGYINPDSELTLLDLACGEGANLYYMGKRYPKSKFIGVDINSELVMAGNQYFADKGVSNCRLETGDIYNLNEKFISSVDGILSFQTLSWLPDFKSPIEAMSKLQAKWIALTSLFYDGPLSCKIEVQDYDDQCNSIKECFYNVYSVPVVRNYLANIGYSNFSSTPFQIDIDLPKPNHKGRGTYTETTSDGSRLQISGPLLMPWHFIAASR